MHLAKTGSDANNPGASRVCGHGKEVEEEVRENNRTGAKRDGKLKAVFSRISSFSLRYRRESRDGIGRFPSFSSRSEREAESERSETRKSSIWSLGSRKSSASSVSRWSLRRRKSSVPTVALAEMGVVREEIIKERQEEVAMGQFPDQICEGILVPPPSLLEADDDELVPPPSVGHGDVVFRDERWLFPSEKERLRQSLLSQRVSTLLGGKESAVEKSVRDQGGVDDRQIKDVGVQQ